MKTHLLDLEDFKSTESRTIIASSSLENKRMSVVTIVNEHLQTTTFYEVSVKDVLVLSNSILIDAIAKYNAITK